MSRWRSAGPPTRSSHWFWLGSIGPRAHLTAECRLLTALDCSVVTEYRAHFDANVAFANGGRLTAEGFRLDLPGPDLSEAEIAELFIQHLGLALVGEVQLRSVEIVEETHKGSRGIAPVLPADTPGQLVDLSHTIAAGLVTCPGIPAR